MEHDKALEINNLGKVYSSGVHAVRGLSLSVKSGSAYALLGPNGAGKSTTIGMITGLVTPTSGSIKVFGHDISTAGAKAKRLIGLVGQEINFNQFESVKNILRVCAAMYGLPRSTCIKRADRAMELLQLEDKKNERARDLSGGMKRRLMIARAIMHKPKLLILDEPTAGVDISIRHQTWELIKQLNNEGTTIILTTHYLEEAENLCEYVGIIDKGKMIEDTLMRIAKQKAGGVVYRIEFADKIPQLPIFAEGITAKIDADYYLDVHIPDMQKLPSIVSVIEKTGMKIVSFEPALNRLESLFLGMTKESSE